MPDPLRLEVHKRLTSLFETITYLDFDAVPFPMVGRVYRGRGIFGNETDVPAISILESPIPNEAPPPPVSGTTTKTLWELVVQGFVRDDRDNPTDPAHLLLAEVKRVLALERLKMDWDDPQDGILGLGRNVVALYIEPGVVRPADELSSKAYFWLTLRLDIVEDLADPYSLSV